MSIPERKPLSPLAQSLLEDRAGDLFPAGSVVSPRTPARSRHSFLAGTELAERLSQESYNRKGDAQKENLAKVASGAMFVVTGQQPGYLGGTALTLYKAMTAIASARELSRRFALPVVPLFWIPGDDSDFAEVSHVEHPWTSEFLQLHHSDHISGRSIGSLPLSGLQGLGTRLPEEFLHSYLPSEAVQRLLAAWGKEPTFVHAFASQLAEQFAQDDGLIFVDGASPWLRSAAQPLLRRLHQDLDQVENQLRAGARQLALHGETCPVPLLPGVSRVFQIEGGLRVRIAKNQSLEGLELTQDALSRPLVCDSVLPVCAHVLGPAELRYFGVLEPLYRWAGIPFPLVQPRAHATLLRPSDLHFAQALGLDQDALVESKGNGLQDILQGQLLRAAVPGDLFSFTDQGWKILQNFGLSSSAQRLQKATQRRLEERLGRALLRDSDRYGELRNTRRWLGQGRPQERRLTASIAFRNDWWKSINTALSPLASEHQIVLLADV